VIDDVYVTAPEGPMAAGVRLNGVWAWVVLVLGAAIVACGGLLL